MRPEYSGATFCGWRAQKKTARVLLWRPSLGGVGEHGPSQKILRRPPTKETTAYAVLSCRLVTHLPIRIGRFHMYPKAEISACTCGILPVIPQDFSFRARGFLHKIHELNMGKGPGPSEWHCSRIVEHRGRFMESRHEACGLPEAPRTTWHQGLAEGDLRLGMRLAGVRR